MVVGENLSVLVGAIALGAVHGIEPGHGWPVAASYALDQSNKWLYGFAASLIIGVGHLISSFAMVAVFFYAKAYFNLTQVNESMTILGGIEIGGPVSLVAGVLLIALGVREYSHGHSHGNHADDHEHTHDSDQHQDHDHSQGHIHDSDDHHSHAHGQNHPHPQGQDHDHSHAHEKGGLIPRLKGLVPFGGGHSHSHEGLDDAADRGLLGIAWFAFVLGFAHEEEFEIIALCAGSVYCLELMMAYALTVILGIVGLTMLLIAGYQHSAERVERFTPYLPVFSAVVLCIMGIGFIIGVF